MIGSIDKADNIAGKNKNDAPTLIHRSESTSIYRQNDIGYKVIEDEDLTEEQILRLMAEEQISQYLPRCCAQRRVLQVKGFRGKPSLQFQWVDGVSLKEWLSMHNNTSDESQSQDTKPTDDGNDNTLRERLRIAIAITKTLSQFHQGDVMHQDLSLDNIILNTSLSSSDEKKYSVSLINLSRAEVITELQNDEKLEALNKELQDLGYILYALFCGESFEMHLDNDTEQHDQNSQKYEAIFCSGRSKRGKSQSPGEGLPIYLTSLISTLVLSSQSGESIETYNDVDSVLEDLQAADRKFHIYFKPKKNGSSRDEFINNGSSSLHIPQDAFYGRQSELTMLVQSFHSVVKVNGQPGLACVSGYGGTGKTSLVQKIKGPLQDVGGYFIKVKFDPSSQPDSVLIGALNVFFGDIIKNGKGNEARNNAIKSRIDESVGSECMLVESIPNLATFLGREEITKQEANIALDRQMQWKYSICKLVGAIAHEKQPIVLFFDDLQWADKTSLDAIQLLVADPDIRYCHYLACYRDDEEESKVRVDEMLDSVETNGIDVKRIKLGPIDLASVNTLISESTHLPPSLCHSLANIAHNRTGGVILFVINFLKSLNEEGLLRFNFTSGRWEYDTLCIQTNEVGLVVANVVTDYLTQQMTRLGSKMQLTLKVSACFGYTIDAEILEIALSGLGVDIEELNYVVHRGYLQRLSPSRYRWAHDEVHQAAYDLISLGRRKSLHLLIGSRILVHTSGSPDDLDGAIFDIVRHMNIGAELIKSKERKLEVGNLNVIAGEKAMKSSSFHSAANYFLSAISLFGEDGEYTTLMNVYDLSLGPLFAIGDFSSLQIIIDKILSTAKSFEEKLNAYHYLIRVLAASRKYQETISKVMFVLEELGENIPKEITADLVLRESKDVEAALANYSEPELLGLPLMTDRRARTKILMLTEAMSVAYRGTPFLLPILVYRMIKLSLEHGLCDISSVAFCSLGALMVTAREDFEGGYRMGRVAIEIMKRFDAERLISTVYTGVYGNIFIWKEPFQAGLDKHIEAYEKGASMGAMNSALHHHGQYIGLALWACGENLLKLEENIRIFLRRAIQYKNFVTISSLTVHFSLAVQLVGSSEDPYSTFFHCSEDEFFQREKQNKGNTLCRIWCHSHIFIALYHGDMDDAAKWYTIREGKYSKGMNPRFASGIVAEFLDGLLSFHFARSDNTDQPWADLGESSMKHIKKWTESSTWNFANKLFLLEAEYYFSLGDEIKALEKYQASIAAAKDHRFVHEEGLAHDKTASFHIHHGRKSDALFHFAQARKCYLSWGAHALVEVMENKMSN